MTCSFPQTLTAPKADEARKAEDLLPLVYDELRYFAEQRITGEAAGYTLQPTELVHEAWLRMSDQAEQGWQDRTHFFRSAAQAMRRILVDRARRKLAAKRGGRVNWMELELNELADTSQDDRVLLVDEMLDRLEVEDPESSRVVSMKFFGGLTTREIAALQGVAERTVERQWSYAKACLFRMMRAGGESL